MTASASEQEELAFAGPTALARHVSDRELTPRELVELCLRRIESIDPKLNAFRVTMAEEALARADAAVDPGGPLAGVPIAIKDDMPVAGQSVTRGSRSFPPPEQADGELVRRLRSAGAIPIGITNVPELMIFPWTASAANGVTRNPWDPTRTPGGSSGGSAAAVASGMVPCATGSDGGGSIRIPAACCGLVGMKPSRGRVSTQPLREAWLGLSVFGALARTVADSALLLDAFQGSVAGDADRLPPFAGSYAQAAATPPGRLRVAISRKVPPGSIARLSPDQRMAFDRTALLLETLGHEVVERDPAYGLAGVEFTQMWMRGIYEESATVPDHALLERSTQQLVATGRRLVPARRRGKLIEGRASRTARVLELWQEADVLLMPVLASTAIGAEGAYGRSALAAYDRASRFMSWNPLFNLTGQPSIALPAGFGADGLPLSIQLVGRLGAEDLLYSLAGQIEAARPWAHHRPGI
ncbi:MAG TPA: amidase family protein [Solirubrobacteraceae bacterium]|nr:amidase family protein [Solirubrobacteraceae bacterium]